MALITLAFLCPAPSHAGNMEYAERFYSQKNFQAAVPFLEDEINIAPHKAAPHYMLGNTFYELHNVKGAIEQYSAAVQVEPTSQAAAMSRKALEGLSGKQASQGNFVPPARAYAPSQPINSNMQLMPGSTRYTHVYQTSTEPVNAVIPIQAAPAKSLPLTKPPSSTAISKAHQK